ncbi:MAG: metal-dependent hydrolase [Acidimicrobiia bacterium]|nr:metal-dependent hydrolase [Acidimicrobiia bacterium]
MTTETATRPAADADTARHTGRAVPTRRISLEESLAEVPKHFAKDGDLIQSHLMAVLSSLFPDGEDFFVRSVRHYRDQITEPELKRQVAGFIGQESVHGREHRVFNDRLDELGYPTKRIEAIVRRLFEFREDKVPASSNLAVTAALEHFTAVLAELLLTDPDLRELTGHPAVTELFAWHALEESEHKAVAVDVYRAVGGTERMRRWTMKGVRKGFVSFTTLMLVASLLGRPRDLPARCPA